ncbi:MAG: 50S ribosomal protein L35 [Chitinophagales bacterium]|nr:50S ribosomal protein L35 [Chitinophagales bacterium]MDW8272838.1 50S ribosomal protein L35 [Chitinophagales bacterium]
MPKVKTNSGAKKRFKVTASGKILHKKAYKRHLLGHKSKKRKSRLNISGVVNPCDVPRVKDLLVLS